jgi:hypothetical protein
MPEILAIVLPVVLTFLAFMAPAPQAGERFPLRWRVAICSVAILAVIAALWQQKNAAQEKWESREEFLRLKQLYAVDMAIVKTRLDDIKLSVDTQAQKNPDLKPLGDAIGNAIGKLARYPEPPSMSFKSETEVRFVHGLNTRTPQIVCVNAAGSSLSDPNFTVVDPNTVTIHWAMPQSGSCSAR